MKIVSINFMKNEEHCVENMLKCVQPLVHKSYVLIDNTSTDRTEEIVKDYGCIVKHFDFENFAKTWNILLKWTRNKCDWIFAIAPDEIIGPDFNVLPLIVEKIHNSNIDGVWFSRRHWLDEEMTQEITNVDSNSPYPDWQLRLIRNTFPKFHLERYVHEIPVGLRQAVQVQSDIHHFRHIYKTEEEIQNALNFYNKLWNQSIEEKSKNIWPE